MRGACRQGTSAPSTFPAMVRHFGFLWRGCDADVAAPPARFFCYGPSCPATHRANHCEPTTNVRYSALVAGCYLVPEVPLPLQALARASCGHGVTAVSEQAPTVLCLEPASAATVSARPSHPSREAPTTQATDRFVRRPSTVD
jgi:hypothetical protein